MDELKDEDIVSESAADVLSDDDIIAESEPSFLGKAREVAQEVADSSAIESALDFSRGVAGGLTMNALDEIGGALGAGIEKGIGALGFGPAAVDAQLKAQGFTGDVDKSFLDTYREYQKGIESEMKKSEERSPYLSMAGQIAGGVTSGVAAGQLLGIGGQAQKLKSISDIARDSGKAKAAMELLTRGATTYAKSAPLIAAESALTSEEALLGEGARPMELAKDVAGGLAFGLPAIIGGQAVSDVIAPAAGQKLEKVSQRVNEFVEESPLLRQMGIAYKKYGQEAKVSPRSEKAIFEGVKEIEQGTPFSQINLKRATGISDKILKADKELGKLVGDSLDEASAAGIRVDAGDIRLGVIDDIKTVMQDLPGILEDKNFNSSIGKILNRNLDNASPREIKAAIDDISNTIDRISSYKYATPEMEEAPKILRKMRAALDQRLKDSVPSYKDAAERFSQFRRSYIEQAIAGPKDPGVEDILYGDLKKGQSKLISAYEDLVSKTTADAQSNEATEAAFSKLKEATKQFEQSELARLQAGKAKSPVMPGADQFMKEIRDAADDAAVRRMTRKTQESQGGLNIGVKDVVGVAQTGRGALLTAANLAGRATVTPAAKGIARKTRAIYNAPVETLQGLAAKLEKVPGLKMYGRALMDGLASGDTAKRNAALFTIMQNPNARALVEAEDEEPTE
jgi:hypothetical protein